MKINSPITEIKGVGEKTKESFQKLGVYTVGDMLLKFPRNYLLYPEIVDINDVSSFEQDKIYAIHAKITQSAIVKKTSRLPVTILDIGNVGHKIELVWFRMPYLKTTLQLGKHFVFYGKVIIKNGRYTMEQPALYTVEQYSLIQDTFQPIYSLTRGVTNNQIIKTIKQIFTEENLFMDHLPEYMREKYSLCEYNYALKQIHFPDNMDTLIECRKRLVFDEFFLFIMGMRYQKEKNFKEPNNFSFNSPEFIDSLMNKLPYELTNAQKKTIEEIKKDMLSPFTMQRLVQGDVGSGKTIVAFLIMAWVAVNGYQSAIMAPTEVLAQQHYESFCSMCELFNLDIHVVLLTGSMTAKQKRDAYERILLYPDTIVVGTHTLIQEKTEFLELALVITDEQHRFGVKQRDDFFKKGNSPHILVMSATPIPRTLAIIIYGDMDISVIDEVPAKRLPIKNCVVDTNFRPKAYSFIEEQVRLGHQAYVICPLVEETENVEGENVIDYTKKLRDIFPKEIQLGVLHGKMKSDKKNEIMAQFSKNEIQVLISTTVVEVGVNVPNATVMMIENADRFGLAQLHQLRGRVGRGDAQSYCIMINTSKSKNAKKRLEILNKSNDGFFIASEDLKLRGPGDFFGIRQSGDLAFQLADIYQDAAVLQQASEAVSEILEDDENLEKEENYLLKDQMNHFMENQLKRMNL